MKSPFRTPKSQLFGRCMMAVGAVFMLSGCDSDGDTPTKPSPALTLQPFSTQTALDQIATRVRVSMRVTAGLASLADAVQTGRATAEVCGDTCNSDLVVPGPIIGLCDTAVGAGVAEIAAVGLNSDEVSVDFCVSTLTAVQNYTTTVSDGDQRSNTVTTACSVSGASLTCTSE